MTRLRLVWRFSLLLHIYLLYIHGPCKSIFSLYYSYQQLAGSEPILHEANMGKWTMLHVCWCMSVTCNGTVGCCAGTHTGDTAFLSHDQHGRCSEQRRHGGLHSTSCPWVTSHQSQGCSGHKGSQVLHVSINHLLANAQIINSTWHIWVTNTWKNSTS